MSEGQIVVFAPEANEASIRACALKAIELGGGEIRLPLATIQLTQPLPVGSGVTYVGAAVPSAVELSAALATGTILLGDGVVGVSPGTFNAFEHNPVDGASITYANPTQMHADGIRGFALYSLVLRGFDHGVKLGSKFKTGVHSLHMHAVIAEHCNWGFWTENCMQPIIGHLYYGQCKLGGFYHACSMNNLWHFGNGIIEHVYGQNSGGMSNELSKGIVIEARGNSSELNNITVLNLQANGYNTSTYTQASAAIITIGSPNITVTSNISKFRIDGAVSFGSGIGGLDGNAMYWIQSVTDNGDGTGSIQIGSARRSASVISPSASGSSSMTLYPMALIEIGGQASGGGSNAVTYSRFPLIDIEAASGVGAQIQAVRGCHFEFSIVTGGTGFVSYAITSSDQTNTVSHRYPMVNTYMNVPNWQFNGYAPLSAFGTSSASKWQAQGLLTDATAGTSRLFLNGTRRELENMTGANGDIYTGTPAGFAAVAFGRPTQKFHGRLASASTITSRSGGFITYSGAGGGNLTLPIITSTMVGVELEISNPSTGTLTVNTQSSQLINNIAATTLYVMAANTVAKFVAATNDGTNLFWAVR